MTRHSNRVLAGLTLCAAVAAAETAGASTYYVSATAGRDQDDGSTGRPWRTLARAVAALHPGDHLIIRAGHYTGPLIVAASGAPGLPIEIIGEQRPLIEADQDAVSIRGSYVVIRGVEAHSTGWGSAIQVGKGNHHVAIIANIARDSGCGGISAEDVDYLTVESNRVFGNARRAPWQCSGISLYQPQASDGRLGYHNVIRFNVVFDNMNKFVDDTISHSGGHTTDGNGIIIDDADHTQGDTRRPPYLGATLIRDNVIFNNGGRGVQVFHSSDVTIVNNVAFDDLKDANLQRPAAEISAAFSRNIVVMNNAVVARVREPGLMDSYTTAEDHWDFNLVAAEPAVMAIQSPVQWGSHMAMAARAPFVHPGLTGDGDFRLRPGSPGLAAGASLRLGADGLLQADPREPAPVGLSAEGQAHVRP